MYQNFLIFQAKYFEGYENFFGACFYDSTKYSCNKNYSYVPI